MINTVLKWLGCITAIAGGACIAFKLIPYDMYLGTTGALFYMIWGYRVREYSIVLVNFVFVLLYFYGLLLRIGYV
jgi:hypothetical protein